MSTLSVPLTLCSYFPSGRYRIGLAPEDREARTKALLRLEAEAVIAAAAATTSGPSSTSAAAPSTKELSDLARKLIIPDASPSGGDDVASSPACWDDMDDPSAAVAAAEAAMAAADAAAAMNRDKYHPAALSASAWRAAAVTNDGSVVQPGVPALPFNASLVDLALVEAAVWHVCRQFRLDPQATATSGAILVFLPGTGEITTLLDRLQTSLRQGACSATGKSTPRPGDIWLLPLHGSLPTAQQRRVFEIPPTGTRKIVLSTNVAETSVTVPDAGFVIDTGRERQSRYDETRRMGTLAEAWCSQASCGQRKGRAGRVRAGHVFRLFTRLQWERMQRQTEPEMRRVFLDQACLLVKSMGLDKLTEALATSSSTSSSKAVVPAAGARDERGAIARVLSACLSPPTPLAIAAAVADLTRLGALHADGALTPLGAMLARLPVGSTRIGRLLIHGALLRCATPVSVIAALLSDRSPIMSPSG